MADFFEAFQSGQQNAQAAFNEAIAYDRNEMARQELLQKMGTIGSLTEDEVQGVFSADVTKRAAAVRSILGKPRGLDILEPLAKFAPDLPKPEQPGSRVTLGAIAPALQRMALGEPMAPADANLQIDQNAVPSLMGLIAGMRGAKSREEIATMVDQRVRDLGIDRNSIDMYKIQALVYDLMQRQGPRNVDAANVLAKELEDDVLKETTNPDWPDDLMRQVASLSSQLTRARYAEAAAAAQQSGGVVNTARVLRDVRTVLSEYNITAESKDKDVRKAIEKIREELAETGLEDPTAAVDQGAAGVPQPPPMVTSQRGAPAQPPAAPVSVGQRSQSPLDSIRAESEKKTPAAKAAGMAYVRNLAARAVRENKPAKIDANDPQIQALLRAGVTPDEIRAAAIAAAEEARKVRRASGTR